MRIIECLFLVFCFSWFLKCFVRCLKEFWYIFVQNRHEYAVLVCFATLEKGNFACGCLSVFKCFPKTIDLF